MRRLPVGFYQVDDPRTIPVDCFTFVYPEFGRHDHWDAAMVGARPLILILAPIREAMESIGALRGQIESARAWCQERGLLPTAVMYSEEWYTHTMYDDYPVFLGLTGRALKDRKKVVIDGILAEMKRAWPFALTLQVENWYNDNLAFGANYYHPPYACDVLGIDAYFSAQGSSWWNTAGIPLTSDAPYQKFELEVARLFRHATRYGKPLLMIPQAFKWDGATPTAPQLRWFFDLAQQLPAIMGLCYYARFSRPEAGEVHLDLLPELLAETQWQYARSGGRGVL